MSDPNDNIVLIAVMGPTGSGKSSFINLASNSELSVGEGLESCTDDVHQTAPFEIGGRRVVLVDTPGFDDTNKSDTEVLEMISTYLALSYEEGKKFAGILYFHRISDFRMGGIARRNFEVFRQLCGDTTLRNVTIVTNMWGEVQLDRGNMREAQLKEDKKFFGAAIEKGAQLVRHDNTKKSTETILGRIVGSTPVVFDIQKEIVDEKLNLDETAAGGVLHQALKAQEEKFKKETEEMRLEMERMAANEGAREELLEEIAQRDEDAKRLREDMTKLQQDFQEKLRKEVERQDRERAAAREEVRAALERQRASELAMQNERRLWAESERRKEVERQNRERAEAERQKASELAIQNERRSLAESERQERERAAVREQTRAEAEREKARELERQNERRSWAELERQKQRAESERLRLTERLAENARRLQAETDAKYRLIERELEEKKRLLESERYRVEEKNRLLESERCRAEEAKRELEKEKDKGFFRRLLD